MNQLRRNRAKFILISAGILLAFAAYWLALDGKIVWSISPTIAAIGALFLSGRYVNSSKWIVRSYKGLSDKDINERFDMSDDSSRLMQIELRRVLTGSSLLLLGSVLCLVTLALFRDTHSYLPAWSMFVGSILVSCMGASLLKGSRRPHGSLISSQRRHCYVAITLFAILVMTLLLRIYDITEFPAGLWYDEADNIVRAAAFHHDPSSTPVFSPSTHLPTLFLIPIAFLQEVLGPNWIAGRLVAILFSIGFVGATFLLAHRIAGISVAFISAYLACVMRWSLNWGRIGMHGITAAFFSAICGYLLLKAIRKWSPFWFFWSGLAIGIGMWFYAAFRMFPLVAIVILAIGITVSYPGWKRVVISLTALLWGSFLGAGPVIQHAILESEEFFHRTRESSIFTLHNQNQLWEVFIENLYEHLMMFNAVGDPNPRHNIPNEPMLDPITGTLFLVGVLIIIFHRRWIMFILPAWVLIMIMPGVLTVPWESPQSLRSIGTLPAVIVISTLPIAMLWRLSRLSFGTTGQSLTTAAIVITLAGVGVLNIYGYFGIQRNDPEVFAEFSTAETIMAKRFKIQQQRGYSLFASRQYLYSLSASVVSGNIHYESLQSPRNLPLSIEDIHKGGAVYLEPREKGIFDLLRIYYPGATFDEIKAPSGGDTVLYEVLISRQIIQDSQGIEVSLRDANNELYGRKATSLSMPWSIGTEDATLPADFELSSSLHIKEKGRYSFTVKGIGTLKIDGLIIDDSLTESTAIELAVGLHTVKVTGVVKSSSDYTQVLWASKDQEMSPIAENALYIWPVRPVGMAGVLEGENRLRVAEIIGTVDTFYYANELGEPYTATWGGYLSVPIQGAYKFHINGNAGTRLMVNDVQIAHSSLSEEDGFGEMVQLERGDCLIIVKYESTGPPPAFSIEWTNPQGERSLLPLDLVRPDPALMIFVDHGSEQNLR